MSGGGAASPSLRAAMERALEGAHAAPEDSSARLVQAALATLGSVVEGAGQRSSATDLLAADALLTRACEAAAESGPEALEALFAELGPERFEALLRGRGS